MDTTTLPDIDRKSSSGSTKRTSRPGLNSSSNSPKVVKKPNPLKEMTLLERYQKKFEFYKTIVNLPKIIAQKEKHKDYRENKKLILEIELVPDTCWWTNIRSNVKESEWDRIRFVTGGLAGFKCEICGERGTQHPVECHEVWIYDEKKKTQTLLKFQSICPLCHQTKHLGFAAILDNYARAVDRFTILNKLTEKAAQKLIDYAFKQHRQRSFFRWKLDINLLSYYNVKVDKIDRETADT